MAADGHPKLYASPIAELAGDIPLVPALMVRGRRGVSARDGMMGWLAWGSSWRWMVLAMSGRPCRLSSCSLPRLPHTLHPTAMPAGQAGAAADQLLDGGCPGR